MTEVTAVVVSVPGVAPDVPTEPPPLGTTRFPEIVTVTGDDEGLTSTVPLAKSRR